MFSKACVIPSVHGEKGASQHASLVTSPGGSASPGILRDTVNERAVRILLECILVWVYLQRIRLQSELSLDFSTAVV